MVNDFSRGASYALGGLGQLTNPLLRPFVIIPLLINFLLFAAVIWGAKELFAVWLDSMLSWLPDWLGFLDWLLWPIFIVTALLMVFYTFTVVANLLGSPFNGLLSEKADGRCSRVLNCLTPGPFGKKCCARPGSKSASCCTWCCGPYPCCCCF